MPTNTLETVWKLILDKQSAEQSEDAVTELAEKAGKLGEELNKIARQKSFEQMAQEAGELALQTGRAEAEAAALYERLKQIGATEDELSAAARAFSNVKAGDDGGSGDSGGGAPAAGKFRGAASLLGGSGAGELVGIIDDLQDAFEGFQQLKVALTGVQVAQTATTAATGAQTAAVTAAGTAASVSSVGFWASAAGLAAMLAPLLPFVAIGAAVAAAVIAINNAENARAEALKQEMEIIRGINDEIAAGATSEDLEKQIEQLQFRSELEQKTLDESKQKYDDYIQSIRDAFGGLGALLEPFIRLFGNYEEELSSQVDQSQKLIDENTRKEEGYQKAIDDGLTSKNDAIAAEEELARSRDKGAKDAERAAQKAEQETKKAAADQQRAQEKAQSDQERANQEAQREAEQFRQKQEQIEQKRYQAAVKFGDSMVELANKTADSAKAALTKQKQAFADNQTSLNRDMEALTADFAISEREQAIERMEQEETDLRQHALKLTQIRDDAFSEETDLLRKRDFLGATKVRERANAQIEQDNKTFIDGQEEKLRLQRSADAKELRDLADTRQKRLIQLRQQNEDVRTAYQRDIQAGKEARQIAERDAKLNRDRELRNANEEARALLGIHQQTTAAILQLGQGMVNSLRGLGSTTNNNTSNVTNNNQRSLSISGASMNPQQIQRIAISTLGAVGLT